MRNGSPPATGKPSPDNGHADPYQPESSGLANETSTDDEAPGLSGVASRMKQWVDQYPGIVLGAAVIGGVLLGYWMKRK